MSNLRRYLSRSITRRFVAMMLFALSLILIGAIFVFWGTVSIVKEYRAETNEIFEKQKLVTRIAEHSNEIILRARGYYVFLSDYEYEQIFSAKRNLQEALTEIKKQNLSTSEQEVMTNIESFFDKYFGQILPQSIAFAKVQDYESLRDFISADEDNPVNDLISYAHDLEDQVQQISKDQTNQLIQRLSLQAIIFILYILLVFIVSSAITRKVAKDIGLPLDQLTLQTRQFANGELFEIQNLKREDELGELANSFQNMIQQIQWKEEELLSQNEELLAQQEELQAQQEELQHAISRMEQNERFLEKQNLFVQALSNTLDQQELLESIICHIVESTESDKGLIVMMNDQHHYASIGISDAAVEQFIDTIDEGIVLRALQTKQSYTLSRACSIAEQGYHKAPMDACELVVPVINADDNIVACLVLTKVNKMILKQEELEIVSMMKQVSLAFDKLQMYEHSESQRLMNKDILNTIQEGIQFLDMNGTTLQINQKMSEIMGFFGADEDTRHRQLEPFLEHIRLTVVDPEPLIAFIRNIFKEQLTSRDRSMNYEINGQERRIIQIYVEPLYRSGEPFGILLVHRDMTKEYEVDRMKSEFVSTVSHELRTPLASVLGFAELMLHRELKPERQRKYVTAIHQEAVRLTSLINDFLDLQRMESGRQSYVLKRVSLMPLIDEVVESQRMNAGVHPIIWHNEATLFEVVADQDKIRQMLLNLISNAVKYSPNGGEVRVISRNVGNQIVIRIEDQGLGIPADALPNLFSKFYRVDNTDRREIGGTGLGLAIVKEIITKHKGSVEVESIFGEGSAFIVSLPLAEMQELSIRAGQPGITLSDNLIDVMLIENDYNLSAMLSEELLANGYYVHQYSSGHKAIEDIVQLKPAIIVIDLMLEPDITGWDIVEKIKKSSDLQNTPIIISSAFEEKEKAALWGINEFLVKPYLPGKLSAAISRVLRKTGEL